MSKLQVRSRLLNNWFPLIKLKTLWLSLVFILSSGMANATLIIDVDVDVTHIGSNNYLFEYRITNNSDAAEIFSFDNFLVSFDYLKFDTVAIMSSPDLDWDGLSFDSDLTIGFEADGLADWLNLAGLVALPSAPSLDSSIGVFGAVAHYYGSDAITADLFRQDFEFYDTGTSFFDPVTGGVGSTNINSVTNASPVPEPSTIILILMALLGLLIHKRKVML